MKLNIVMLMSLCLYFAGVTIGWASDEPTAFVPLNHTLPGIVHGSVAWADYDNDGAVDLALTGYTELGSRIAEIYHNTDGVLARVAVLTGMAFSTVSWVDYDNDTDLDILISGFTAELKPLTQLYRNDDGSFVPITTQLLNVYYPAVSWGDYDNDGDVDLALGGLSEASVNNEPVTQLYRNDNGDFTLVDIVLPSAIYGAVWVDYDTDGDLDLAGAQLILRNDGAQFTEVATPFADLLGSRIRWHDYDHDGDSDLLATGQWRDEIATRLYENSAGVFVDTCLRLPGLLNGNAYTWADVDLDGDDDIFLAGGTDEEFIAKLYLNIEGEFSEAALSFPGIQSGTADWGDIDGDGDLDLLYSGQLQESRNYHMGLYRNDITSVPLSTVTPQPSPTPEPSLTPTVPSEEGIRQTYLPHIVR
ncbi:MAG: VCBS repeat-containing protein [Caldilineaceae bacterium]|nr:VCBS repeat-containing protein [Caldilineaceae bacterium]